MLCRNIFASPWFVLPRLAWFWLAWPRFARLALFARPLFARPWLVWPRLAWLATFA